MAETPTGGGNLNDRMAALRQQQTQASQPQDIRTNQFAFDEEQTPMQAIRNWIAKADIKGFAVINVLLVLALFGILSVLSFLSDMLSENEPSPTEEILMDDETIVTVAPEDLDVRVEVPRGDASDVMVNKEAHNAAFDETAALAEKANGEAMSSSSDSLPLPSDSSSQDVATPSTKVTPQPRDSSTKVASVPPPPHLTPRKKPTVVAKAKTPATIEKKQPNDSDTPHHDGLPRDFKRTAFASNVYQVQLGAFSHQFQLENEWLRLKTRYPSLLQNLSPAVNTVNYGSSGVLYRLRLGPFADEKTARALCVRLQAAGFGCVPIKPSAS